MIKNLFLFALFLGMLGCEREHPKEYTPLYSDKPLLSPKKVYIFGVHPLHNPKHLFEIYQPMVEYINARIKGSQLRLEASRDYASYDKKLFSSYFDFSLPNPYQTVIATTKGYKIFGKMADDENFRGIILVRKDSNIEKVTDLRGKTVSYPAPTALAATMMPQWYMYHHGLDINHDIINSYVGSQESSIMNLFLGKSSASSTWPPPWLAFIKKRPEIAAQVEVKWITPSLPNNGLVAREDINQTLVDEVGRIIFGMDKNTEGQKILATMELSRFVEANDTTYDPVRVFIKQFEEKIRPIRVGTEND